MQLKWIQSNGGPLVAIPEESLKAWMGVKGSSSTDDLYDYDRACEIEDELGIITSDGEAVLVLGDEPHQVTWIEQADGGLIVRWVYAQDENEIAETVGALQKYERFFSDSGVKLSVRGSGSFCLFDAADPGNERKGESLSFRLNPGRYKLDTAYIDPSQNTRLLIHRFVRINNN